MSDRQFALPAGGAYTLTDATLSALLGTGSGDAARVYLYLLRQGGACADKALCAELGLSVPALNDALSRLQKARLLSEQHAAVHVTSDTRPDYSGREVAAHMEKDSAFRHVAEETQRRLGRVLSSSDLQILFGLYDWRGFPPGVVSLLVSHCLADAERRWGPDRMPTLRQIDKEAARWERDGVITEERAERYITDQENARKTAAAVYRALGVSGRAPSPSEERYVNEWAGMGFPPDAVTLAYDKTVLNTGGLNWKYMHTILKSWHDKGLHTVREIETGDARPARTGTPYNKQTGQSGQPAAPDERERQAREKMRRFVENG